MRSTAPRPRASISLTPFDRLVMGVLVGSGGETAEIVPEAAEHIFVRVL